MDENHSDPTRFVTFYSYKGGVGRSMAVLNVSALLAARGFRVLIIDFDLEAPGLTHLIQTPKNTKKISGVVELFTDAKENGEQADLFAKSYAEIAKKYTFKYKIPSELKPNEDGRLSIMPSGCMDKSYAYRLDALDLKKLYSDGLGKALIRHFKKVICNSGLYDYVIVDSRTGHSDEAGICTRDLADHLMIVTGFNRQNISGTASFLTNLRAASELKMRKTSPSVILSPVPIGEEDMLAKREKAASKEFKKAWGAPLHLNLYIPYHPRLALTEDAYVTARTASYLRDSYNEIEARLLSDLGHEPQFFLSQFRHFIQKGNGASALKKLQVFVKLTNSYADKKEGHYRRGMFDLRDNDLLSSLLKLPEAKSILQIHAEISTSTWDLCQLGKKLHNLNNKLRSDYDEMIVNSNHPDLDAIAYYAIFLGDEKNDYKAAEKMYLRAIQVDSPDARNLSNYAIFLSHHQQNYEAAEKMYLRAMAANPQNSNTLGNYGQFLIGEKGFYKEGLEKLQSAWLNSQDKLDGNAAELSYSLWLVSALLKHEEKNWLRSFKHIIQNGFDRHKWSFNAMLKQAEDNCSPATYKYAKTLTAAFFDESKLPALEKQARWKNLVTLNPQYITPEGKDESVL